MDPRSRSARRGPLPLRTRTPPLHLVTDDRVVAMPDFHARAEAAARAGGERVAIHLRAHASDGATLDRLARALRAICDRTGARLWVNDRADVALAARADGVQVGRRGLAIPDVRALVGTAAAIGFSAHSRSEGEAAVAEGADVIVLGPVFETASHPGAPPLGLETLRAACGWTVPVVAIGGITPARVEAVRACGAAGVAALSGAWDGSADATDERVRAYLEAWDRAVECESR